MVSAVSAGPAGSETTYVGESAPRVRQGGRRRRQCAASRLSQRHHFAPVFPILPGRVFLGTGAAEDRQFDPAVTGDFSTRQASCLRRPENFRELTALIAGCPTVVGYAPPCVTHPATLSLQIDASRHDCRAAADYRTSEKAAGIISLFSCRTGRTPVCAGHAPPGRRDSSRTRARSLRSLYTQM